MKNSYRFFQNNECEFFPCHKINDTENFSCLFCYCPLYHIKDCGGNRVFYLGNSFKDCSNCTLPHMNYEHVIQMLRKEHDFSA